jgi:hypothetical protein
MSGRSLMRLLPAMCGFLLVASSVGCQTIFPTSRPYTGLGATRNAAGDVIILVRTCKGLAATKLQLSADGYVLWLVTSTGDASPVIRQQVGQVGLGWRQDAPLSSTYDPQRIYTVGVWFSGDNLIGPQFPSRRRRWGV